MAFKKAHQALYRAKKGDPGECAFIVELVNSLTLSLAKKVKVKTITDK